MGWPSSDAGEGFTSTRNIHTQAKITNKQARELERRVHLCCASFFPTVTPTSKECNASDQAVPALPEMSDWEEKAKTRRRSPTPPPEVKRLAPRPAVPALPEMSDWEEKAKTRRRSPTPPPEVKRLAPRPAVPALPEMSDWEEKAKTRRRSPTPPPEVKRLAPRPAVPALPQMSDWEEKAKTRRRSPTPPPEAKTRRRSPSRPPEDRYQLRLTAARLARLDSCPDDSSSTRSSVVDELLRYKNSKATSSPVPSRNRKVRSRSRSTGRIAKR
ncbi:unnamed protein product [Effrenium voratum]|nr:unnamed protein product [Effrenium voratum]